jgi:hypothetical protein
MTDARTLAIALGGKWYGRYGSAPCPVCQPERRKGQNALSLRDGRDRLLAHCKKSDCGFRDILAAAGVSPGDYRAPDPSILARREAEERADREKRARQAERLWQEAQPIAGTVAAHYLRDRMITCDLPGTLRFHPECWHGPTAKRYPAMVALVEGGDAFAVHRTYLSPDGSGKAAIDRPKAMLGPTAGGAVRLTDGPSGLVVAEGIETALSLACGLLSGPATIWAALSTSGMQSLRLPDFPGRLTIAPDGDKAGQGAALTLADRASREGWAVSILTPPPGGDFNDMLCGEVTI